ncbi:MULTISPECIES: dioxygenase [unclassified Streptomyces]|uniref:dioxygenase family protein n=1 Tax=Streptomyces TaxID=1883 RepID=UPI001F213A2A|nr:MULTISPECIES: dioxygenase [unclassified Streptomyces]MCF0090119.1 Catechol 1,2-dioxygenase 1 [Streptomyces sp. MH192]MCF0102370.1 Catechol 1,2-dioxygenase 1 [Streptomyces sp. MH191]
MSTPETRLQVVFADLRRAVDDVVLRHRVTPEELFAAVDWLRRVADAGELPLTGVLFLKSALQATEGAAYAHPETDGATPWEMEGPAHLPGSPELPSPAVLPMRPEEPGEPLVVSGTVRGTSGAPLPGAVLDVWQIDADNLYSGVGTRDFEPLDIPNDSTGIPVHNLRGRVVTDAEGRYEFRTVMPGVETFGFAPDSPLTELAEALRLPGLRPLHIHAIVTAEGCLPLTTQIYFDGDPLAEGTLEGPVPAATVRTTVVHDTHEDYRAHGLDRPYRALTHDIVLRPVRGDSTN